MSIMQFIYKTERRCQYVERIVEMAYQMVLN